MWAVYIFYAYKFIGYITVIAYWVVMVGALMKAKDLIRYKRYADYIYLLHFSTGFILLLFTFRDFLPYYVFTAVPLLLIPFTERIGPGKVSLINFLVLSGAFFPAIRHLKHLLLGM